MDLDDVKSAYSVVQGVFHSFTNKEAPNSFNSKAYHGFFGIENSILKELHKNSTLKNNLPVSLTENEYFILLSVIGPFYYPDFYTGVKLVLGYDRNFFSILGGKIKGDNKCFYPTGETILFLLCGHSLTKRGHFEELMSPGATLFSKNLIDIIPPENGSPYLSGQLYPTDELLARLKLTKYYPEYSSSFPASRIKTRMNWEDLILPYETHEALEELNIWMKYGHDLIQHPELGKRIKPGYRTLFYGPPGTGKTLTASLIGKTFGVDVYRIDLSMVVSKWVGETEKNLKGIFDQAMNKNWILFFDEADSLFGKRTNTSSSNDRYANQEVSYLLQRIEDFPGLVILASNLKSNIDEAFNRRFQSAILFPMPDPEIRFILWEKAFPKDFPLEPKVDLMAIANKYELAGGAIINIVRYCVLKAMERQNHLILHDDIEHSIIREFKKEGKIVS